MVVNKITGSVRSFLSPPNDVLTNTPNDLNLFTKEPASSIAFCLILASSAANDFNTILLFFSLVVSSSCFCKSS